MPYFIKVNALQKVNLLKLLGLSILYFRKVIKNTAQRQHFLSTIILLRSQPEAHDFLVLH